MPVNRQVNINTESVDNYLKAIFTLSGPEEGRVSSTALADKLGVAPASITNMLQKLASSPKPFVEYERYRGVRLSPEGKRRALEVLRHHRLIETYLYEVLRLSHRGSSRGGRAARTLHLRALGGAHRRKARIPEVRSPRALHPG